MANNSRKGPRINPEKGARRGLIQIVMGPVWGMKRVQIRGFLSIGAGAGQEAVDLGAPCLLIHL